MGYTAPHLEVRKITGGWALYGPSLTTTDDLDLFANGTDSYANIRLYGNGGLVMTTAGGSSVELWSGSTNLLYFTLSGSDSQINTLNNNNIFLQPNGTGYVKFGTYVAVPAADSTGYIGIRDADGNLRKLMVQA